MNRSLLLIHGLLLCAAAEWAAAQAPSDPATAAPGPAPAATAVKAPGAARPQARPGAARSAQAEAGEPRADNRSDRVDLDTTTVTGNRELPKVMYVVPWKKSDIGDFVGKPMNSLLDEVLAPVDRDVFRREVGYYNALNAEAAPKPAAVAAPSPQGEK